MNCGEIFESNEHVNKIVYVELPITQLFTYFKLEATGLCNFYTRRIAILPASFKEVKIDQAGSFINTSDELDINIIVRNTCKQ